MASETSLHYATAGTTVRHLLDMRSGIGFREDYLDAHAEPTNKQKIRRRRDLDRDIERLRQVFTDTYLP